MSDEYVDEDGVRHFTNDDGERMCEVSPEVWDAKIIKPIERATETLNNQKPRRFERLLFCTGLGIVLGLILIQIFSHQLAGT